MVTAALTAAAENGDDRMPETQNATNSGARVQERARFEKLAVSRTSNAIQAIQTLSNCLNRQSYEYGPDDWEKILGALTTELEELSGKVEAALAGRAVKANHVFSL